MTPRTVRSSAKSLHRRSVAGAMSTAMAASVTAIGTVVVTTAVTTFAAVTATEPKANTETVAAAIADLFDQLHRAR